MRESHVMIPSKLEQVGQLALNYISPTAGQFTISMDL